MKTVPVRELSQNGASRVITMAEAEPVLITKNNEPSVWMVSASAVALASAQLGDDSSNYHEALAVVAVDLYDRGILSIGRAARLAGMPLAEFIFLCGRLHVSVLREPPGGLEAEVAGLEAARAGQRPTADHCIPLPETAPVPQGDRESIRVTAVAPHDNGHVLAPAGARPDEYLMAAAHLHLVA